MTAEIAVLNAQAVALAADSAVTIETTTAPADAQRKVYNTVNKLFALSKHEPVGIMVYGNASIAGLPAETVIKQFRVRLGARAFPTVEGYVEALAEFLAGERLCSESEEAQFLASALEAVFRALAQELRQAIEASGLSIDELPVAFDHVLQRGESYLAAQRFLDGFAADDLARLNPSVRPLAETAFERVLGDLGISAGQRERTLALGLLSCLKDQELSSSTGLVVAGFGRDEYRPALHPLRLWGRVEGRPQIAREPPARLTLDAGAAVRAFAQRDMVATFMEGVDPESRHLFRETVRRLLVTELPGRIEAMVGESSVADLGGQVRALGERMFAALDRTMDQHRREARIGPVIEAVQHLGKEDLAALAEALVQLTSLKRRFTLGPETVGGPIDVAVISKHDGFIWMRRKHYFQAELNPQFLQRYFGGGAVAEGNSE